MKLLIFQIIIWHTEFSTVFSATVSRKKELAGISRYDMKYIQTFSYEQSHGMKNSKF